MAGCKSMSVQPAPVGNMRETASYRPVHRPEFSLAAEDE